MGAWGTDSFFSPKQNQCGSGRSPMAQSLVHFLNSPSETSRHAYNTQWHGCVLGPHELASTSLPRLYSSLLLSRGQNQGILLIMLDSTTLTMNLSLNTITPPYSTSSSPPSVKTLVLPVSPLSVILHM